MWWRESSCLAKVCYTYFPTTLDCTNANAIEIKQTQPRILLCHVSRGGFREWMCQLEDMAIDLVIVLGLNFSPNFDDCDAY